MQDYGCQYTGLEVLILRIVQRFPTLDPKSTGLGSFANESDILCANLPN